MPAGLVKPSTISALGNRRLVLPVAMVSDWIDVCTAPQTAESDTGVVSGGVVVAPGLIVRAAQSWLRIGGLGTSLQIRLKYPTAGTVTASPTVQPFGRDRNALAQRLLDGSGTHTLTLSADAANDVRDGTFSYTQPLEVDADANVDVLVAVHSALTGTGLTGATIQARVK